jgi:hypothetical protein
LNCADWKVNCADWKGNELFAQNEKNEKSIPILRYKKSIFDEFHPTICENREK